MTAAEALTALAPIVGSGGIVSVLLAWIGYKQQAGKGREDPAPAVSVAYGSAIPKSADIELLANATREPDDAPHSHAGSHGAPARDR
jgi:hypothetical protein